MPISPGVSALLEYGPADLRRCSTLREAHQTRRECLYPYAGRGKCVQRAPGEAGVHGWLCMRAEGHEGQHVATNGDIAVRWPYLGPQWRGGYGENARARHLGASRSAREG